MEACSLRARAVFPVSSEPILDGVVNICGERIASVGRRESSAVRDLGDVALVPGFVNAHTHLEFSDLRSPLGRPGMPLPDWIRLVIGQRSRQGHSAKKAIIAGLAESLSHGVTAVGDISKGPSTDYEVAPRPDVTQFHEVIGFSNMRSESVADVLVAQLDATAASESLRPGISPHAPYSVSPRLLEGAVQVACERSLPVAMHLAESTAELELLEHGTGPFRELLEERSMWDATAIPPGSRPLDYLRQLSQAPRALIIHGNYLAADEFSFLGEHRDHMTLIHCPRTHAYFGHPAMYLAELQRRGVSIALGTDSRASNPDLCVLSEMRFLSAAHPDLSPLTILEMGTLAGAKALGWGESMGALAPELLANFVAIPIPPGVPDSCDDILAAILSDDGTPSRVWLRGQEVTNS